MTQQRPIRVIYLPDFFRLWKSDLTVEEICERLNAPRHQILNMALKYQLPRKPRCDSGIGINDPTPEEIQARIAEVHAMRQSKTPVSKHKPAKPKQWQAPVYEYDQHTGLFNRLDNQ